MLLIQMISGNIQCFTKPLEVIDLSFSQETKGSQYSGVIGQVDQVFVSRLCFLFCCTFVSVMC